MRRDEEAPARTGCRRAARRERTKDMTSDVQPKDVNRYARAVEVSKRVRWEIDADVLRGRELDFSKKFLPDGLSGARELSFLCGDEQRLVSQIQGRTYANMFGL